jgi:hypothetical protein
VLYSEQLDNAAWIKNVATITANASVSPDGYTNADTLTESTFTSDSAFVYETLVVTASTAYTTSVFVKQGAGRYVYLRNYYGAGNAYHTVVVDTQTGTITQASVGSGIINASSSIEAYGNGWYRVRATQTSTVEIALFSIIGLSATATPTVGSFGQITIASNAGRSASVWGCQVEAGAYATSYIPTLGASVTRVADAASKTGVSSLIGQTEGVLYSDFNYSGNAKGGIQIYPFYIGQGTFVNSVTIGIFQDQLLCRVFLSGTAQNYFTSSNLLVGRNKVAFLYATNNLKLFLNGVLIATDTSATIPACDQIYFGSSGTSVATELINVNTNLLFKNILTNAQLAELTAL